MAKQAEAPIRTIQVYIDDGRIYWYTVSGETEEEVAAKVREHASAIVAGGYRHNDGKTFEHYPSHRILKVKSFNIPTSYVDSPSGT